MLGKLFGGLGGNTARLEKQITELDKLRLEAEWNRLQSQERHKAMLAQQMQQKIDNDLLRQMFGGSAPFAGSSIAEMCTLANISIKRNKTTGQLVLCVKGEDIPVDGLVALKDELNQIAMQALMDETK